MVKMLLELAKDQLMPSVDCNQEMEGVPSPSGSLTDRLMERLWPMAGVPSIRKAASPSSTIGVATGWV